MTDACYLYLVEGTADLVTRLEHVHRSLSEAQGELARLAAERRALVVELHDTHAWTDARIASVLGVTRAAVQLIRSSR